MNNAIVVRPVRREDFQAWQILWDGYNAFYGREGATRLADSISQITWSRFFDEYEPMHALVAEHAGAIAGLVHFLYHRSTIYTGPVCYLQDLFTAQAARAKGIASALIEAVYAHAAGAGSKRVYWLTHETNTTAMKLYDKLAEKSGFTVYRHLL